MTDSTIKQKLAAKIGAGALALLVPVVLYFEGTVTKTYKDPIGIITACVGHTGPELKMGQTFTPEQCQEMLYADLLKHSGDIDCIKRPLRCAGRWQAAKNCPGWLNEEKQRGNYAWLRNETIHWYLSSSRLN